MPDPIKKTTSYDPSTGETTFKASWSGNRSSISRGPITPKTTQRTVAARQVSSPASKIVASRSESAGQRMAVAFKSPTMADRTNKPEIKASPIPDKAPKAPLTKREIAEIKTKKDDEDLKKNYPGMSVEDARAKRYKERVHSAEKSAKENRRFNSVGGGDNSSKQKSAACTTC